MCSPISTGHRSATTRANSANAFAPSAISFTDAPERNSPLPVEIFSEWLGVPEEAHPQFRYWTSWVARSRDPLSSDERVEFYAALDATPFDGAPVLDKKLKSICRGC